MKVSLLLITLLFSFNLFAQEEFSATIEYRSRSITSINWKRVTENHLRNGLNIRYKKSASCHFKLKKNEYLSFVEIRLEGEYLLKKIVVALDNLPQIVAVGKYRCTLKKR